MDPKAQKQALEKARALEKAGQADAAVKLFRDAGALEDAARVLGATKGPRDAGQLLLESLHVPPAQVGQLDAAGKKRALMAAIFFGKAGENELAVQLFMGLGEQGRAVELLQRSGDQIGAARLASTKPGQYETGPFLAKPGGSAVGGKAISIISAQKMEEQGKHQAALDTYVQLRRFADAARVAGTLGRDADAAQFYADAGMPAEAAAAYLSAGDTGKALDNLTRVQREDPRYRTAAAQAVRLATNLGVLDFRLEQFLGAYVKSGPQDATELQVFDLLAKLYLAHDFPENAREALEKLVQKEPGFPGARERLAELNERLRPSAMVARQVLSDADLHKRQSPQEQKTALPDLGDLPGLPEPATILRHDPAMVRRVTGTVQSAASPPAQEIIPEAEVLIDEEPAAPATRGEKFALGGIVAARYRLDRKIGQGGMASVFRAWDLELEENVALKVFGAQLTSEVLVARFRQELKMSRQLMHPNIIRLYDIGVHEGHRYISMELLVGKSLKERMEKPIEFVAALDFLIQACSGLQAAHDAGVVHRDVKPDNFFVTDDGVLKVMDFGIAKQYAAPGVTVVGSIAGTPLYMSPEQIGNFSTVTHLTDLYALGICAYEMFTGSLPFTHDELVPLLMMHVNNRPGPPAKRNPAIPPDLDAAILRLLEKDPTRRFQSCRELGQALSAIRSRYSA